MATRYAPRGMVCAVDHLAANAGIALLRQGGTAVDAAVGTSAVLAVTAQHLCGMGGDLFALVSHPTATDGGPVTALCASGRAGSGADPDRLRDQGHQSMPFRGDIRAVPVPGCVDGWAVLHARYGELPLSRVLAPAIAYAEDGFPATQLLAATAPLLAEVANADDVLPPEGRLRAGDTVFRLGVARALRAIVAEGRDGFYGGEFGTGLLELGDGEYTAGDLAQPQAQWVAPLSVEAWGHHLWTVPPPSQGYLLLASASMAATLPLPGDPDDPAWAHLLIEAAKQAGFDRPDVLFDGADGAALLAPERLASRRAAISADVAAPRRMPAAPGGTIALCVVDDQGHGVSLIQSNASGFGAHIVEPRTGIFLQNRGIGFSLEPGHPAEYGPGRRPPHTLSPCLVSDDGDRLVATLGTMGGDSQPQILLQVLARLLHARVSPGAAIDAPRWQLHNPQATAGFSTWAADDVTIALEPSAPVGWEDDLRARGHTVERAPGNYGHAHLIDARGPTLAGASDARALSGAAAGW